MKTTRFTCLLLLAWGVFWGAPSALALDLVYPADKTYVTKSNYIIIKAGEQSGINGFTIEINGINSDLIDTSNPEYQALFKDMLIVQPEFDPGVNKLRIVGFVDGEEVKAITAEIYYLDKFYAQPPEGYTPFVMHVAEREAGCVACHVMEPGDQELMSDSAATNPCGACHQRMLGRKHVHGPAGVFECIACHDPDTRPQKYLASVQEADLCTECHDDKVEQFKESKFIHGPVEAGYCQTCHDPHASDEIAQVIAPINELCLACHEKILDQVHVLRGIGGRTHPLEGVLDPSGVGGRMLSCASCHDPHGGNAEALFQRGIESKMQLCQICHKK